MNRATRRAQRPAAPAPPVTIPQPFAAVIDAVCAADAAFFREHPALAWLERPYVEGEFWPWVPPVDSITGVRVTRGPRDGMRFRALLTHRDELHLVKGGAC